MNSNEGYQLDATNYAKLRHSFPSPIRESINDCPARRDSAQYASAFVQANDEIYILPCREITTVTKKGKNSDNSAYRDRKYHRTSSLAKCKIIYLPSGNSLLAPNA